MKDHDRLNLLKDVAGTKVYETRRADSLRLMEETNKKKENIQDLLDYIAERLNELDEERKELKEYHEKDKERRCLEYALFYKELQDAIGTMEDLDTKKKEDASKVESATRSLNERDKVLIALEESLANLEQENVVKLAEREALVEERRDLARSQANLESAIRDAEERSERTTQSRPELEARLRELDSRISEVEGELMGHIPQLQDKSRGLAQARAALDETKAKATVLYAKQTRSNQYTSQAERDAALREELQSLERYEASQATRRTEAQEEAKQVQEQMKVIETSMTEKAQESQEGKKFMEERAQQWDHLKKQEDTLQEKKK
jgi:structural maintenance of chromosome 3 (chondroitin sulfate proteoglycan 6)